MTPFKVKSIYLKICLSLLVLLAGLHLSSAKSYPLTPALVLAFWFTFFLGYKSSRNFADQFIKALNKWINKASLVLYVISVFFFTLAYFIFDYFALNGTLWDLTQYLQETYRYAFYGNPQATFSGQWIDHFHTHRSISLEILAILTRLSGVAWPWLFLWQSFFLFAPGLVAMLWYQQICRQHKQEPLPLGYLLAFLTWAMMPTVLRMEAWPHMFYMMGFSFIALAYYFYFQKKWFLWLLVLVLASLEKEDFGVVTVGFGLLVFFETLFSFKKRQEPLALLLALSAVFLGAYSFLSFHHQEASVVTFASRFSSLGHTPSELIRNFFSHPVLFFKQLLRPDAMSYSFFFAFCSFAWLFPRLSVMKYFFPVSLVLLANLLSDYAPMRELKDTYALPVIVGLSATMILGGFRHLLEKKQKESLFLRSHLFLLLTVSSLLLWGHQSVYRTLKDKYILFNSRKTQRTLLKSIREDKTLLVCCEERICSYLAERPFLLEQRFCTATNTIYRSYKEQGGNSVMFVSYSSEYPFLTVKNKEILP